MKNYLELLDYVLTCGDDKDDRTGTGTLSVFGHQMRFNLADGFPLVTTKKCHLKSIIHELLWFISGDTSTKYLNKNGVRIWDDWSVAGGRLGPIYGAQWRSWPTSSGETIDQLKNVIDQIKSNPDSRRLIVSAWNPEFLPDDSLTPHENVYVGKMALAPCHTMFQFCVSNNKLSCQLYQRSADVFLGVPFNIASYALLTMMIAQACNLEPGGFVHTFGDVHLYKNHIEQAKWQLQRDPKPLPKLKINCLSKSIFDIKYDDIEIAGYDSHPAIYAPIAV